MTVDVSVTEYVGGILSLIVLPVKMGVGDTGETIMNNRPAFDMY